MIFDDIFGGEPRDKFFDIVYNANRNIVENELEILFSELVALRELAESSGITQTQIDSFKALNPDIMENGLNDIYIDITGKILTQNE
ncbi:MULTISPECIES: DUF2018 family protein [Campylobacter]|uniref:DUF2018 domain protein n=1 Tax=Campylobacter porcelli TaxID=1660073 RepID=A0A1X9SXB4_9BACT|nr:MULTISPECIES: DUF2018 family protein [unclassified Campylobacter]MCR8679556.1 DUF2018 family protein [Campylobacter sp. RM19072]MCR8696766.1 DUF2018 family protein [Campylobacter sp. RM19073]MEE3744389.1 DUF2018 family protein [Campylobacter sp. CX2-4855-23]MEE3777306.1 DUF2018 family protein [Campylobacter sp. CX2-4080-23]ARR00907.1 DUF2018 domain protein [Campylobacter sp. RM6137]